MISDQQVASAAKSADLQNTAWEVSGGWVLTGEEATYNGLTPRHPFDPRSGHWGAWQLVARYAGLDVDNKAFQGRLCQLDQVGGSAQGLVGRLELVSQQNIRADLSFSHTDL